jgi:GT2 family glycosyltransferase
VLANCNENNVRIILIDDGSRIELSQAIDSFSKTDQRIQVIRHEDSKGYTKSANAGLAISDAQVSVILNSDTEVSEGWLSKILAHFRSSENIGIVGVLSNAAGHQSIPRNSWKTESERLSLQSPINSLPEDFSLETLNHHLEKHIPKKILWSSLVHGFCFSIRRETLENVGLFDEELFGRGYGEENDYCIRASNAGWGLAIAADTYVWHHKSGSFSEVERTKLIKKGSRILEIKHGEQRIKTCIQSAEQTGMHIERIWEASLNP